MNGENKTDLVKIIVSSSNIINLDIKQHSTNSVYESRCDVLNFSHYTRVCENLRKTGEFVPFKLSDTAVRPFGFDDL